jgi:hypothetical protein
MFVLVQLKIRISLVKNWGFSMLVVVGISVTDDRYENKKNKNLWYVVSLANFLMNHSGSCLHYRAQNCKMRQVLLIITNLT